MVKVARVEIRAVTAFVTCRTQLVTAKMIPVPILRMLMETSSWNGRPLTALPLAVPQTFLVGALSRGIAHEIGHYLLRSREHAARGLMRANFSGSDILSSRRGSNRLDADEMQKVRRHLTEYAATASSQPPV